MNKKIVIGIILVLLIYVGILLLLFGKKIFTQKKDEPYYLIIGNKNYTYKGARFFKTKSSIIEESNQQFDVYLDETYFGNYFLKYGSVWNLLDNDKNFISYSGDLVAFSTSSDLKFVNGVISSLSNLDKDIIRNKYNHNDFNYLLMDNTMEVDINNDGINDRIVFVTNYEDVDKKSDYYHLIYASINNKDYLVLNDNITSNSIVPVYKFGGVLRIGKDNYLLVKKIIGFRSDGPIVKYGLYKFDGKKFQTVIAY